MKPILFSLFIIMLTACGTNPPGMGGTETPTSATDSTSNASPDTTQPANPADPTESDYATFFVVVADTGRDYAILHQKMFTLNKQLNIPIDTMERTYNPTKDLIALPENSEDEIYAGDYFPRRFPSENLSLEYLNFYEKGACEKTIALVAGIYETESSADSALTMLQKAEKRAFEIKAEIYIGCMH